MNEKITQAEKATQLYKLHHTNKLLLLPNIWDVLGARLLEDAGYTAIATASAAIAWSNGYNDGENIPFKDLLHILKRICAATNLPVTADIESGYAKDNHELKDNICALIDAGIVGINIEDTDARTNTLLPVDDQCSRIEIIKAAADKMHVPLFINARTDTFIHAKSFASDNELLQQTIERGKAYAAVGAECFYPILINKEEHLMAIAQQINIPINVLMMPGTPSFQRLESLGIARVSLGPGFLKYAIKHMKQLVQQLQQFEGMQDVVDNEITSDYLKRLVQHV